MSKIFFFWGGGKNDCIPGFSLDHLDMGGTSARRQSVNGGTPEGGQKPYEGGGPNLDRV